MRLLVVLMHNERWRQYTWGREKYFVMLCNIRAAKGHLWPSHASCNTSF